jgi:hypothetical protein
MTSGDKVGMKYWLIGLTAALTLMAAAPDHTPPTAAAATLQGR